MCAGREGVTPPSGDPGPVSLRAGKNRSGEGEKNMSVQARGPSKNSVRKAGSTIRRYARGESSADEFHAALEVVSDYRATFSAPLVKVNNGLRGFLRTLGIHAEVTQRLKRMDTIVEKISERETGLSLDRMGDIGGCRVVLKDDEISALYDLDEHIRLRWSDAFVHKKDYIAAPRESGYRAIHLLVKRDGRLIEIQLRTANMHIWAELVEAMSQQFGRNFKQDGGHHPVDEFARSLSEVYQAIDRGEDPSEEIIADLTRWQAVLDDMLPVNARDDDETEANNGG